ncbi:hypothetical protein V2J09_000178 [Rumex salicifolius]
MQGSTCTNYTTLKIKLYMKTVTIPGGSREGSHPVLLAALNLSFSDASTKKQCQNDPFFEENLKTTTRQRAGLTLTKDEIGRPCLRFLKGKKRRNVEEDELSDSSSEAKAGWRLKGEGWVPVRQTGLLNFGILKPLSLLVLLELRVIFGTCCWASSFSSPSSSGLTRRATQLFKTTIDMVLDLMMENDSSLLEM